MADRRPEEPEVNRAKRARIGDMDPSTNPYLAHMYKVEKSEPNGNGYLQRNGNGNSSSPLSHMKRHHTTALQAHDAEDGPNNPFNNKPLSSTYFNILKTRRDLPVHKQR